MGGLFSQPKMPEPPEPERMPAPDDEATRDAERAARADLLRARGRESTNLTGEGGETGYTGTVLGAGGGQLGKSKRSKTPKRTPTRTGNGVGE